MNTKEEKTSESQNQIIKIENKNKKYVQDLIDESNSEFNEYFKNPNCCLFICGGVNMGNDVMKKIESLFGINHIKQLENEKRLLKELWG